MNRVKIILGILMIFGMVSELSRTIQLYNSGEYGRWPWGVETGAILAFLLAFWLIRSGMKKSKK